MEPNTYTEDMQCGDFHHEDSHEHEDAGHHHPGTNTEVECLQTPSALTMPKSLIRYCPADWDPAANLCWPKALPGTRVTQPCPDKPGINPQHLSCRQCLFNGTWEVRQSYDPDQPFTNYHDCFVFEEQEFKIRMELTLGKDKLVIYETLSHPGTTQLWWHGVSVLAIALCLFLWILLWFFHNQRRPNFSKYKWMSLSSVSLLVIHILTIVYLTQQYHEHLPICYLFMNLTTCLESIMYTGVLCYSLAVASRVSKKSFSKFRRRMCQCACVFCILVAVGLETWIEVARPPRGFCILGLYLNPFHWLIIGFKLTLVGASFSVCCVSLYALFFLNLTQISNRRNVAVMRENMILFICWTLYCLPYQLAPIFLDHMYTKVQCSISDVIYATRVNVMMNASRGIVFSFLTCFLDIEMIMFVFRGIRKYYLKLDIHVPFLKAKVRRKQKEWDDSIEDPSSSEEM